MRHTDARSIKKWLRIKIEKPMLQSSPVEAIATITPPWIRRCYLIQPRPIQVSSSNPTDLRIIWPTHYRYINTFIELIFKIWVSGKNRTLIICMKTHFYFFLNTNLSLLVICWNMRVIDSGGTLVGVFRIFSSLHYVQKQYYKYLTH